VRAVQRSWNNPHYIRSYAKYWKDNNLKACGSFLKPKGLSKIRSPMPEGMEP